MQFACPRDISRAHLAHQHITKLHYLIKKYILIISVDFRVIFTEKVLYFKFH